MIKINQANIPLNGRVKVIKYNRIINRKQIKVFKAILAAKFSLKAGDIFVTTTEQPKLIKQPLKRIKRIRHKNK